MLAVKFFFSDAMFRKIAIGLIESYVRFWSMKFIKLLSKAYFKLSESISWHDEKIKEVILTLIIMGDKNEREIIYRDLKRLAERYQIKLDIPKLRQMECWQSYDLTTNSLKDYSVYLPTLTLAAGFPFTKTYFNDSSGYMLGIDLHTSLPMFYDPFVINNQRTSHNIAIVSSTGGESKHTLLLSEMPRHSHYVQAYRWNDGSDTTNGYLPTTSQAAGSVLVTQDPMALNYQGESQPHNNMPPYYAVNIWRRVS